MAKPPLKEFQRENVEWIRAVGRGLLADEPGLGKSRSALEGLRGAGKVLIVAPSLVLETGVWHEQVELWGDDDCKYYVAPYSQLNRRVKTGKGSGSKPVNALRPEWRGHWDAIIFDEAHYLKGRGRDGHGTMVVKAAKALSRKADSVFLLTGTPIPNWDHELFTLLQIIHAEEGKTGGKYGSFWRWAEEWFITDRDWASPNEHAKVLKGLKACTSACMRRDPNDPCEHYMDFARGNLGSGYMRHLRADHLDLPPLEFVDVPTRLAGEGVTAYRSMRKDFAADIDGKEVLAWSQGAKHVKLDKITTSPWLLNPKGEPRGGKFEQLRSDLQKRTEPTVVFAHYRDSVEGATRIATSLGLRAGFIHGGTTEKQNAALVRDFKRGRIDVLIGSLETMSEGLTLTLADTAIMLERSYKPSRNTQATYRIHRMGQTKSCKIIRYLTPGTVDSGKEVLLQAKNDHQMRTLTAADLLRVA